MKTKGAVPLAHLVCANPFIDIYALVRLLKKFKQVLFIGHHNKWVLFLLAQLLPDTMLHALDEDGGVVSDARNTKELLGISNVTFFTQVFDIFQGSRGITYECVVYVPKFHTSRPFDVVHTSRIKSVHTCSKLVAPGGTFIMCAAMMHKAVAQIHIPPNVLDQVYAGYARHDILSRHIGLEIRDLYGKTLIELLRFLLTHASMGYAGHIPSVDERVPPDIDGNPVYLKTAEHHLYVTERMWRENYVMFIEDYITLLTLLRFEVTTATTATCARLRGLWTALFNFDIDFREQLNTSGLIVAQKPK